MFAQVQQEEPKRIHKGRRWHREGREESGVWATSDRPGAGVGGGGKRFQEEVGGRRDRPWSQVPEQPQKSKMDKGHWQGQGRAKQIMDSPCSSNTFEGKEKGRKLA